ncbi:Est1-type DNA/RNA-binding domain-containing protein [Globomyces pollinis-pini]|nr:Est1-type DNA/RNA-binding domain-containing protein [Globomyces pollinis-pini]
MYLMPENGNPFNQLAVIDTYQASEFSAIEMYFRSLVVKKPFSTAMDNLLLLFQKSSAKFETISDHTNSSHFQTYFITLHSYLFGNAKE